MGSVTAVTTFGHHLFLGTDRGTAYMFLLPDAADPMDPLLWPVWEEQVLERRIASLAAGSSCGQLILVAAG